MGLMIKGIEFTYPGTTRLVFGEDGRIANHRDYFDFVGPPSDPFQFLAHCSLDLQAICLLTVLRSSKN